MAGERRSLILLRQSEPRQFTLVGFLMFSVWHHSGTSGFDSNRFVCLSADHEMDGFR